MLVFNFLHLFNFMDLQRTFQNEFRKVVLQDLDTIKDDDLFEVLDAWIPPEFLVRQICSPYSGQLDWKDATHVS